MARTQGSAGTCQSSVVGEKVMLEKMFQRFVSGQ